jgi:1,4-dihydroxy-2-naphthoate polyprenyltransferase
VHLKIENSALVAGKSDASYAAIWFRAVRFHYVPPSFLPAILGSLVAWSAHYEPDIVGLFLVVAGVTINHFGLNMLDDVCDYVHSVDHSGVGEKNPYTGGSGVLTEGLLTPFQMAWGAIVCFTATAAIGLYLAWLHGWPVLAFGLFGLFCSVFYTLPPIKFGYRGLGELGLLVNFGPTIGLGSYYVQTGTIAMVPLMISLVLGTMMWSMIIINEIPDYEEDSLGGKLTLVVRLGRQKAVYLYVSGLVMAYLLLLFSVWKGMAPMETLAGLVSLPLAVKSVMILKENYPHKLRLIPANLAMIKVHLLTGSGMIAGYFINLLRNVASG